MVSENFMLTSEFYSLLFLVLNVVNRYCKILGTVPELTVTDIGIEPLAEIMPCPLIRFRIPLVSNTNPADLPDTNNNLEMWREYLQEYLALLINANMVLIHPLQSPDNTKYSPVFVHDVDIVDSALVIDVYFIDNPLGYRQMQKEQKNRFQPSIGLQGGLHYVD